jgi:hypothetical protein
MHDWHTGLKVLPKDNGDQLLSEHLFVQQEQNAVFGKHKINSQCQCNKCADKNPVPLPHMQECFHVPTPHAHRSNSGVSGFLSESK